ncbi:hypothetical protein J2129_000774 [Methanofollis sp. W23]|uniref:hypothetical protein n=1 Tax=Methanofollis sp. W23 TaxID=2817849 RepID=UPI001AE1F4A6|nr:hypothetical protein [Methanofollis sp. W23]MBP2145320.1 hypothetical protein [Methanofollis sp. W23]
MDDSEIPDSHDQTKWIMYHLMALEYGHDKFKTTLSELTEKKRLNRADPSELRSIIRETKKLSQWYQGYICYHQRAAMDHIPETQRTKWEKEFRKIENKSYFNTFINTSTKKYDASKNAFKSGHDLMEEKD